MLTTQEFIERSQARWGDRWNYSKVVYRGQRKKVTLICPEHGEFETEPKKHLRGVNSCGWCTGQKVDSDFVRRKSEEIYGKGRWLYDRLHYRGASTEIEIGCPIHQQYFFQTPNNHYNSIGCRECSQRFSRGKLNLDIIRNRSEESFGVGALDFSEATYINNKTPIKVRCVMHDEWFHQQPEYIYYGQRRCPKCQQARVSKGEDSLGQYITSLGISWERRRRDLLGDTHLEVDIYIPELRIAIEFNGLYYHSEEFLDKNYHKIKRELALQSGITLYQIWENDWRERRSVVEKHLQNILNVSTQPKVAARNTQVTEISSEQAKSFLNEHHIQGFVGSTVYVGLIHQGDLVAVGAFKKRAEEFELTRYATSCLVRGGHSKIVAYFEKCYTYSKLVTFADLTFGDGSLYRTTGWQEDKYLYPDYFYTKGIKRYHKFNLRLNRFKEDPQLIFEEGKTEHELAKMNGFLRVYDAGKIRFVKVHPNNSSA